MPHRTVKDILACKGKEKITALTAYDFPTAAILDEVGIDILLVGDSLGNVVLGLPDTLSVTLDMMIHHTLAVSRAATHSLVVADMPFGSYQPSISHAIQSATRLLSEGRAQAVKLEGGKTMAETISRLVDIGIPVMGHIGLTPQSVHQMGGYFIQGKTSQDAERIMIDAHEIEKAGAFSVVLECVEPSLTKMITEEIKIPTIGIGSGTNCDGQILVINDLLGWTTQKTPKFVEPVANLRSVISESIQTYINRVKRS